MEREKLKGLLEALIFASDHPIKLDRLHDILSTERKDLSDKREIKTLLEEMAEEYRSGNRGIVLQEVAGGYQLRTKKDYAPLIKKLAARRPPRFGRAAMETLAIVAYRQPVTRAEIDELRGVDSGGALRGLLEKRLIRILGRKEVPGKPIVYGTSNIFLEHFGLRDLSQLPPLKEFVELDESEEIPVGVPVECGE